MVLKGHTHTNCVGKWRYISVKLGPAYYMHFDADRAICQIIDSKICDENVISGFTVQQIKTMT